MSMEKFSLTERGGEMKPGAIFAFMFVALTLGFLLGAAYIVNFGSTFDTGYHVGNLQAYSDIKSAMEQARRDFQPAVEVSDRTGKIHLTIYTGPDMQGAEIAGAGADARQSR